MRAEIFRRFRPASPGLALQEGSAERATGAACSGAARSHSSSAVRALHTLAMADSYELNCFVPSGYDTRPGALSFTSGSRVDVS